MTYPSQLVPARTMKHFKDADGNLFGLDDDAGMPAGYEEITVEEARKIAASKVAPLTADDIRKMRAGLYLQEADPLFFKAQRGEATIEEWQAKVAEIRTRYPYPQEADQ